MKKIYRRSILIIVAIFVLSSDSPLRAQSIWQDLTSWEGITIEFLKPNYVESEEASFLTSTTFLGGRFPISRALVFSAELPFSYINWDVPQGPDLGAKQTFGNPYFGIEYHLRQASIFFELGARAPLTAKIDSENGEATLNGAITDFVDRSEAFATDTIPVTGFLNYVVSSRTGFSLRLRGGPSFWLKSGDREESETFILYSVQIFYETGMLRFGGGLSGRYIATLDEGSFDERSIHQLTFCLDIDLGALRPGFYIRIPMDEQLKDVVNVVYGIGLAIDFD
jgi:hypothetical protein